MQNVIDEQFHTLYFLLKKLNLTSFVFQLSWTGCCFYFQWLTKTMTCKFFRPMHTLATLQCSSVWWLPLSKSSLLSVHGCGDQKWSTLTFKLVRFQILRHKTSYKKVLLHCRIAPMQRIMCSNITVHISSENWNLCDGGWFDTLCHLWKKFHIWNSMHSFLLLKFYLKFLCSILYAQNLLHKRYIFNYGLDQNWQVMPWHVKAS